MKFKIDLKIFLFAIVFLITNQIKIYAMIMFFALIHEFGHLIVGILLGMKAEKIEIKAFGVSIDLKIKKQDYNLKIGKGNFLELKKIIVASAGPITNVLIIVILNKINIDDYYKTLMIFSNIILIIFNILPIYPLDGGRILKSIIHIKKGKYIAEKSIYYISYITLIILTAISSIAILYLKNIAIFLIIIVLWLMQFKEYTIYRNKKILYEMIKKEFDKNEYKNKNINIPIENKIN